MSRATPSAEELLHEAVADGRAGRVNAGAWWLAEHLATALAREARLREAARQLIVDLALGVSDRDHMDELRAALAEEEKT